MTYQTISTWFAASLLAACSFASVGQAQPPLPRGHEDNRTQASAIDALQVSRTVESAPTAALTTPTLKAPTDRKLAAPAQPSAQPIAKVQAHTANKQQAAILYVRNIPVLAFLDSAKAEGSKADAPKAIDLAKSLDSSESQKTKLSADSLAAGSETRKLSAPSQSEQSNSPAAKTAVWRASAIAARLNQLGAEGLDATKLAVRWDAKAKVYRIEFDGTALVDIDDHTFLADTTKDLERDALQATNRLRRLLGAAAPLSEVANRPDRAQQPIEIASASVGNVRQQITGWASWYGPGFHGNLSASGEVFNQNAMTAAHRSLRFGTRVRVTNLSNNRSVVVRVNDRGPYAGDRIMDLSAGAASAIGLIDSGVGKIRMDVLE
jgi:rare lipoprotein A